MRTLLSIFMLFLLSFATLQAQSPPFMNYQGVARSTDGTLMQEQAIGLRISVLTNGPTGPIVYSERHAVQTNEYGLFTLRIGAGDIREGALDALDWGKNSYWLQVELDASGGTNYSLLGASQLLSVPYAFHAIHADKADRVILGEGNNDASGSSSSNGSPWSTRGNVATDAALDFVGTSDDVALVFRTDNLERMRLTAYGKLGVGTPTPASSVDVNGNLTIGSTWAGSKAAPENGLLVEGNVGIGELFPAAALEVSGEAVIGKDWTGVHLPPLNGVLIEGRVGIGTPGPGSMLGVKGGIAVGNKFSENEAPANGAVIEGKVGIGTTIPQSKVGIAGNASIGSQYAREFEAPSNGLIVQGDVGFGTEAPLSRLGVAGNVAIGSTYASTFPAPEDGLMVEGVIWSGVTESEYEFHVLGDSYLDGTAEITGNTKIGGTLDVDGVTTIHDLTDVPVIKNMNSVSDASFDGSFRTMGGAGVKKNLNVGVDLGVGRDAYVGRDLSVGGTAKFKNLIVENYADIGTNPDPVYNKDLNPDPKAPITFINEGEAVLEGQTRITDLTESTNATSGALVVSGGVGIAKNLNLGGQVHIDYSGQPDITNGEKEKFPMYIEGAKQGIAIKINESGANDNTFVGFWDTDRLCGKITGETKNERHWGLEAIIMEIGHAFEVIQALVQLKSDLSDVRIGTGFGVVVVSPGTSKIVASILKVIGTAIKIAGTEYAFHSKYGVAYTSNSGDYAEWLERRNPDERLSFGDIVGSHGGKISRDVVGADMVFVVSQAPIVLGNVPPPGSEHLYEKCAFLGQVPVKVTGDVHIGDYIIPSGRNNGLGIAVAPDKITVEQCKQVVGVAWSTLGADAVGYVVAAVGMPIRAGLEVIQRQQETIQAHENRIRGIETVLQDFIPDLDARLTALGAAPLAAGGNSRTADESITDPDPVVKPMPAEPDPELITMELFNQAIGMARDGYRSTGQDPDSIELLRLLDKDVSFRATYLRAIKALIRSNGDFGELDRIVKEAESHP